MDPPFPYTTLFRSVRVGRQMVRHALDHAHACALEPGDLGRIVGQQPDLALAEQGQHPRGNREVARVDHEAEPRVGIDGIRSEEHTSELQSLMRISYAVFCLEKKKITN